MTEMADLYDACLDEVDRLAATLTPEQLASVVPATPAWTVHQVIAHLAGSAADASTGRMDGAPGSEWTARHVAELEGRSPGELAASLRSTQAAVAASTEGNPRPAIVWNISVHLADVHEALGLPVLDAALWQPVLAAVGPYRLAGAPARVRCGDEVWGSGDAEAVVTPYELFRALFSRRSRAQMQAWGSPALTAEQLDGVPVFGPRDDDQPLPA
ncbi:DinB family protein [Nocardioides guangzhouensis]|uniref:DinB family protein n=1 Tax=Nocardioides guangzhouensis TaxID=2497878 RepID=A0A4Q4Z943_9ACTN|nr:maleylpyruvate isomerase N-terminal domain-containing protein [Nocardioides guangzhouensis]RYP83676.1 DinB family protein [Nocardioides guangzhouensis]